MATLSAKDKALLKMMGQNAAADEDLLLGEPVGFVDVGQPKITEAEPTALENQAIIEQQVPPKTQPMNNANLRQQYQAALEEDFAAQQQGIDQQDTLLREQLKLAQANQQTNLTPAYDLLNSWYGLDAGKSYRAPSSEADMKRNQELLGMLQASKQKLTGSRTAALKALLEDEQKRAEDGKAKRSEDRFAYQIQKDFNTEMEKQVEGPARKLTKDLGQIEEALKPGPDGKISISKFNSAVTNTAKNVNSNPGALSDTDVARIDFTTMSQRAEEFMAKFADAQGRIDASRAQPFLEMVAEAKNLASSGINQAIETKRLHYSNPYNPAQSVLYAGKKPYAEERFKSAESLVGGLMGKQATAKNEKLAVPAVGEDPEFEAFYAAQKGKK